MGSPTIASVSRGTAPLPDTRTTPCCLTKASAFAVVMRSFLWPRQKSITFSPVCSFFPLRDVHPLYDEPQGEPQLRGEGGQDDPGEQILGVECRGQHLRQAEDYVAHASDHQK